MNVNEWIANLANEQLGWVAVAGMSRFIRTTMSIAAVN